MKKAFFFIIGIYVSFFSLGQTIPLDSFYVPGANWTEVVTTDLQPCSLGRDVSTGGIVYKIERDSIISGKTYHLMSAYGKGGYSQTVNCISGAETYSSDSGSYNAPHSIFATLRTDSNRVYFTLLVAQSYYSYGNCDSVGKKYLFYDFNIGMDSVVPATLGSGSATIVSSIDSVSLSSGVNVPRYNRSLIYGIGSEGGFIDYFNLYRCGPGPDASNYLLCYDNPRFSYHISYPPGKLPGNLQYDCFDMTAYIDSVNAAEPAPNVTPTYAFNIYPNPATISLAITDSDFIRDITITNILGQVVYSNPFFYAQKEQINIADMPAGIYFVKVNGLEMGRFVKQ